MFLLRFHIIAVSCLLVPDITMCASSVRARVAQSKETTQQTINTIKTTDSLKAVKVAYDLTANTMTSMSTLAETVKKNTDNLNLLAAEVLEVKKEIKRKTRTAHKERDCGNL